MTEAVKEVVWFNGLLKDIGMGDKLTRKIRCDSLNAVKLANGGNYKTKSKLLNRKCYFIRDATKQEDLQISHVSNERMTADCLTKPVSGKSLLKNVKLFLDIGDR